jgi:very-short-patch-repair endonuclease
MAKSTTIDYICRFCKAIVAVFGKNHLRALDAEDTTRIWGQYTDSGFPIILRSINYMH